MPSPCGSLTSTACLSSDRTVSLSPRMAASASAGEPAAAAITSARQSDNRKRRDRIRKRVEPSSSPITLVSQAWGPASAGPTACRPHGPPEGGPHILISGPTNYPSLQRRRRRHRVQIECAPCCRRTASCRMPSAWSTLSITFAIGVPSAARRCRPPFSRRRLADEEQRTPLVVVQVRVAHRRAVDDQRVVEQVAVAVRRVLQLLERNTAPC